MAKRTEGAGSPASAPSSGSKPSPFGAARPREAVIAERTGVKESDVIKQDAATYVPKLRLSREQSDDQAALEGEVAHAKKELEEAGDDAGKAGSAKAALSAKEGELKALLDSFEVREAAGAQAAAPRRAALGTRVHPPRAHTDLAAAACPPPLGASLTCAPPAQAMAVEQAKAGGGKRPSERRAEMDAAGMGAQGGHHAGERGADPAFGNFGGRARGGASGGGEDYGGAFGGRRDDRQGDDRY